MPNRILKESIRKSDTINALTWEEEVFFYRLLTACDDFGRYDARPSVIIGECFPLRMKWVTDVMVEGWLHRLAEVGLLQLYTADGKDCLQVTTWKDHQQVRATKSKYPPPQPQQPKQSPATANGLPQEKTPDITCNQMQTDGAEASDINCNQVLSDESDGKQMSPYSYSYSRSDIRESDSIAEQQMTVRQKLDIFRIWLQENCDKALFDPMVLENRWGRYLVEGFEVETLKLAVMDAADHGAAHKPVYIWRILDAWRGKKAFKSEDAKALLEARSAGAGQHQTRTTSLPKYQGVDPDEIMRN